MLKIGITGQAGFIGNHLYNTISLLPESYALVEFKREYFDQELLMDEFVSQCDVIVHLAAMNRNNDPEILFETNLDLVNKLIKSLNNTKAKAHVIFSSSSQEERDNLYGKSKKQGRELFIEWATQSTGKFTGLIIPNVYGPFGSPDYNSFIATFCYKLTHNQPAYIETDSLVKLIYIDELIKEVLFLINKGISSESFLIPWTKEILVSEVLAKLEYYKTVYCIKGIIPEMLTSFELNLFNTFRSYIDQHAHFPISLDQHIDPRGSFVEIIRLGTGGQVSFSTTIPGITRGNHFHTRKIERFAIIKGKALIKMRKIRTTEILDFYIDGTEPAYVDMPIWYTHNITNIGDEELYTIFWINEFYNLEDADTYFESV